ncbi:hypothetical protein ScPMuIL_017587 [Solemya velum]
MATSGGFKQDMPPSGGYGPIEWAKKIPKRLNGYLMFGGFIGFTAGAWLVFAYGQRILAKRRTEMNDARIAVSPLQLAEQHRMMLRRFRENRDEEAELMKDVEDWEVGSVNGKPVYHNLRDRFIMPSTEEYFAHVPWYRMYRDVRERYKH